MLTLASYGFYFYGTFDTARDQAVPLGPWAWSVLCLAIIFGGSSLDYGIVVAGAIELLLDDGSATLVEQGGIVIQRGTIHSWRNPSANDTARVVFVLIDAKPATVGGEPLRDIHPRDIPQEA